MIIAVFLYDIFVLTCWTALAIVFKHWWIALFSILFLSIPIPKIIYRYYRICDKCGKHSSYALTEEAALEKAQKMGWLHVHSDNSDYCPECRKGGD